MIIEGTLYWPKLDTPRDNYNKQRKIMNEDGEPDRWGREYTVTFGNLTKETKLALRDAGILDRVKNKMDDLEDQMTFRLDEFNRDGEAQSIKVVDKEGVEWDWKENGLIGNGSVGAMKFNVWRGGQGKPRIYPVSMMVLEHVEYEATEGSGDYEDPDDWSSYGAKGAAKPAAKKDAKAKAAPSKKAHVEDDLDDEIPFDFGN